MSPRISDIRITKTGEDSYTIEIPDSYVDEETVNGSQLMGMLVGKRLMNATQESVLGTLDGMEVGQHFTTEFENEI